MLFFAFAGYARVATLGEEVRDPVRRFPIALGITLVVYAAVAVFLLRQLGPARLASTSDPIAAARAGTSWPALTPVLRAGAALAALGSLPALVLGVPRTTLARARDGHLPAALAAVHPRFAVPHRAEVAVGVVVAALVLVTDLRGAIGFSSFAVLTYYAIANASAWTLGRRVVPVVGLAGCVVLAFSLPPASVISGCVVLAGGGRLLQLVRRRADSATAADARGCRVSPSVACSPATCRPRCPAGASGEPSGQWPASPPPAPAPPALTGAAPTGLSVSCRASRGFPRSR
ncbi:amino acid transporter [Amycolatopsis thermophila]|uniref:Amino acid transporter n=1 Tax=Amycolatopsis thermophila TaxID=206084 RepID=A0ABU0EXX6_9PSEU|nr:amino acid transporter [Amycolatopsis thermophila]